MNWLCVIDAWSEDCAIFLDCALVSREKLMGVSKGDDYEYWFTVDVNEKVYDAHVFKEKDDPEYKCNIHSVVYDKKGYLRTSKDELVKVRVENRSFS